MRVRRAVTRPHQSISAAHFARRMRPDSHPKPQSQFRIDGGTERCDAVRCGAMRCDAMRCDVKPCSALPIQRRLGLQAAAKGRGSPSASASSLTLTPTPPCAIVQFWSLFACLLACFGGRGSGHQPRAMSTHSRRAGALNSYRIGSAGASPPLSPCCAAVCLISWEGRMDGWMDGRHSAR